jgi:filamentous hemagglutinin family protein
VPRPCAVLAGLLIAGLLLAPTASAQTATVAGNVVSTSSSNGTPPTISSAGDTTTITLNSPRTILVFDAFDHSAANTLNFEFADRSDVALVRLPASGVASVDGEVNAGVGAAPGGNVWFSAPGGVVFGPHADVDAGGLQATSGAIADMDLFAGNFTFAGTTGEVAIQAGAQIKGHGGPMAFVGRAVSQSAASSVGADTVNDTIGVQAETEVAYGAMRDYTLDVSKDLGTGDYDLLGLMPAPTGGAATGTSPGSIDLAGSTLAGDIFVASLGTSPVTLSGPVNAIRAAAIGGDIAVATGGGVSRADQEADPQAPRPSGAAAQPLNLNGPVNALGLMLARATGSLTVGAATGRTSGEKVALSTDSLFVNNRGPGAIDSSSTWVVYAATPAGSVPNNLNSATQALWNRDIDDTPPRSAALGAKRYVFGLQPTLTFESAGIAKTWDEDASGRVDDAWFLSAGLHPGVANAFLADTAATAYSGTPAVTSAAEEANTLLVDDDPAATDDGPYPIDVGQGTLTSASGYAFAFEDAGALDVDPVAGDHPPAIGLMTTGTAGDDGWFTSDVAVRFPVTDPDMDAPAETGCGPATVTADTAGASFTCQAIARGRRVRRTATVKRDATPPTLAASATSGGRPYAEGTVASSDVQVRFTCTDGGSGVSPASASVAVVTVSADGDTALVPNPGVCQDGAGNTTRSWFGPVRIRAIAARLRAEVASAASAVRRLGLRKLVARGYKRSFSARQAGVVTQEVLMRGTRRLVVARGTARFAAAGTRTLKVKPTRAGGRALRGKRRSTITIRTTFTPAGGKAISAAKAVTVGRR